MKFDDVIIAHINWKKRIKSSINSGDAIDPNMVAKDNTCELGKWIYGEGAKLQGEPMFEDMKQKHARFHAAAAETAKKAAALPKEQALALLAAGTPFSFASAACVSAITNLRMTVEKK